jgi:glycerophosphoryl diester phosphodiesterase
MTKPSRKPKLVGHRGAPALAEPNTLRSFEAALQAGVEMIELDVLPANPDGSGPLFVAHDYSELASRPPLPLELALAHLANPRYSQVELDLDLKLPGYVERVGELLLTFNLLERSLVSCQRLLELDIAAARFPELRRGWAVPSLHIDYRFAPLARLGAVAGGRIGLPRRAEGVIAAGRADALMAHWLLVTPELIQAVHGVGGELYVWTVRDQALIGKLSALGVDGLIVDDPGLVRGPLGAQTKGFGREVLLLSDRAAAKGRWSRWRR